MTAARIQITSEDEALAILAEVKKLVSVPPPAFVDESFPKQAAFIKHVSRHNRKAVKCTRRAGKSMAIGRLLYKEAYEHPGCSCLYLGLTKLTARKIMWKDVMKRLNRELKLGASFNETTLTVTLPNGSEIYLVGADSDAHEMEKVLGGKLRVAVIDEAGSFRIDLRKLVYENLEPALADYDGYMVLAGTPTEYTKGLFYDVTRDVGERERGWDVFEWNTFDNPYMEANWRKRIDRLVAENPRIVETPSFIRMYLGRWVVDLDDLCYKFSDECNVVTSLPNETFAYVLGIDLGFDDATAMVVAAYSPTNRNLYYVEAYRESGLIISSVAERIRYYQSKYPRIHKMIVDNASKQSVEELKQRHQLPLEPADKAGKADFIRIMNSDFQCGTIKLLMPAMDDLASEYAGLIWDKKAWEEKKKREEHPGCDNHLADAALYSWRYCYQYLSQSPSETKRTPEEKLEAWEEEEAERVASEKRKPFWERGIL